MHFKINTTLWGLNMEEEVPRDSCYTEFHSAKIRYFKSTLELSAGTVVLWKSSQHFQGFPKEDLRAPFSNGLLHWHLKNTRNVDVNSSFSSCTPTIHQAQAPLPICSAVILAHAATPPPSLETVQQSADSSFPTHSLRLIFSQAQMW